MADTKIINIKVDHNLEATTKSTNQLTSSLKGASNATTELGGKSDGLGKLQGGIDAVGNAVSGLNPAFGAAIKSSNGLILKMWEMVANPIGAILAAIVVTLKFLYESFQSSVAGGKELKAIFAAVSAVGTQVKDAVFGLGRALINVTAAAYKFITLDFKGAAESMKKANQEASNSYKQLGNAVDGTTFKIIRALEKQQQANDKARKVQAVVQSETNKLLVQSREVLTDETASIKEKKKALEEVTKAEIASSKEKERIALKDLQIAKVRAKAMGGEEEKKAKGELRELEISYNEAQTENAMTAIKLNKQKKMLGRQEVADAKAAADEIKTLNEEKKAKAKEVYDADKTALEEKLREEGLTFKQRRDLIKQDLILSVADKKKLNDQINKEEQKSIDDHNKAIADLNKKYDDEKLNRLADTAVKKENLDYERQLAEINRIATTELEKQTLIEKLDAEHKVRLTTATLTDAEKKAADKKIIDDKAAADKKVISDKEIEDEKLVAQAKKEIQDATFSTIEGGLTLLKGLFEKNKAVQKGAMIVESALGIAKIIINTQTANAVAAASPLNAVDPSYAIRMRVMNTIGAAVGIASNIAATAKGLSALGGGAAPSGGAGAGGGGGVSAPAAPSFNVVGNSGVNQIAGVMQQQGAPVVKTYVTAGDVTTAQGLNRNIVSNATLG